MPLFVRITTGNTAYFSLINFQSKNNTSDDRHIAPRNSVNILEATLYSRKYPALKSLFSNVYIRYARHKIEIWRIRPEWRGHAFFMRPALGVVPFRDANFHNSRPETERRDCGKAHFCGGHRTN
jgi:hypothetical protein